MTSPSTLPDGPWQGLFRHALTLIDEIRKHGTSNPFWTFGGGTVLMLRHGHRVSKDVDIFVSDPQYLGYVNPRISDAASETSAEIVAKKMWHRGDRPTARDLFDPCLVIEREPESLKEAGAFLVRHRDTFLRLLKEHRAFGQPRFDGIRTLGYTPSFDYCVELAEAFLRKLPGGASESKSRRR